VDNSNDWSEDKTVAWEFDLNMKEAPKEETEVEEATRFLQDKLNIVREMTS